MKKPVFLFLALLFLGLVLAGCDNDSDKGNKGEKKFKGFTLTVNGLPVAEAGKIYGASLMADAVSETPVAIGVPNSGVFYFYHPSAANPIYPGNEEFTTAGAYILLIARTNLKNPTVPEAIYEYTGGTPAGKVTYSDTIKDITLEWNGNFTERN